VTGISKDSCLPSSSIRLAIDAGVNYFDLSPSYGDAEIKLGKALEPQGKKNRISASN
jgi:aryl-alcohol dehydrogenase-like predicted oxidoreductase